MSVVDSYVTEETLFERVYVLPKRVSAIQVLPSDDPGSTRLGLLTQLPEGAEIEIGGPGFNDLTLKVRCGNAIYCVFLDDLNLSDLNLSEVGLVRKQAGVVCA